MSKQVGEGRERDPRVNAVTQLVAVGEESAHLREELLLPVGIGET
jgi:hypothetical protein